MKYASIVAFGAVAQHFKNDMVCILFPLFVFLMEQYLYILLIRFSFYQIVDKIRVQMDAFLEDGSHEATIAVVHALVVAVPHTTDRLKDYILNILPGEIVLFPFDTTCSTY